MDINKYVYKYQGEYDGRYHYYDSYMTFARFLRALDKLDLCHDRHEPLV